MNRDEAAKMVYEGAIMLMAGSNTSPGNLEAAVDWAGDVLDMSLRRAETAIEQPQKATDLPFNIGVNLHLNRREAEWLRNYLREQLVAEETELESAVRGNIFSKLTHASAGRK